jgi:hypothetical protein
MVFVFKKVIDHEGVLRSKEHYSNFVAWKAPVLFAVHLKRVLRYPYYSFFAGPLALDYEVLHLVHPVEVEA